MNGDGESGGIVPDVHFGPVVELRPPAVTWFAEAVAVEGGVDVDVLDFGVVVLFDGGADRKVHGVDLEGVGLVGYGES